MHQDEAEEQARQGLRRLFLRARETLRELVKVMDHCALAFTCGFMWL